MSNAELGIRPSHRTLILCLPLEEDPAEVDHHTAREAILCLPLEEDPAEVDHHTAREAILCLAPPCHFSCILSFVPGLFPLLCLSVLAGLSLWICICPRLSPRVSVCLSVSLCPSLTP